MKTNKREPYKNGIPIEYEKPLLSLLSFGSTAKEIAPSMNLSHRSIESLVLELRKKHHAKNVQHLVAIALRKNIIK